MNKEIPIPPKFPECRVEFRGRFYSESEFKTYKASSKYKWDIFWDKFLVIMLLASIVGVYITMIIVKL